MASVRTFDTLGYAKFLTSKGVEVKVAEALAEANHEFLINDLATKEFVHNEIEKVRHEIAASENRLLRSIGKMLVAAVGVILAGIPIVLSLAQKLG